MSTLLKERINIGLRPSISPTSLARTSLPRDKERPLDKSFGWKNTPDLLSGVDKARQGKARQDETRRDTTRHDTTRHDTTTHNTRQQKNCSVFRNMNWNTERHNHRMNYLINRYFYNYRSTSGIGYPISCSQWHIQIPFFVFFHLWCTSTLEDWNPWRQRQDKDKKRNETKTRDEGKTDTKTRQVNKARPDNTTR